MTTGIVSYKNHSILRATPLNTLLKDWQPEQASKPAQMLAEVHQGACRFFKGVPGPD